MKKITRRNFLKAAMLTTVGGTLVACGEEETVAASSEVTVSNNGEESTVTLVDEQVLNYALTSDPTILDSTQTNTTTDLVVACNIGVSVTRLQMKDGVLASQPYGAASWEQSEDGMTWTFTLADVIWEDDVPVTAQHYVDGLKRIVDPITGSVQASLLTSLKNAKSIIEGSMDISELGVVALDDKTLQVELEEYIPYFLDLTYGPCFMPIRLDVMEEYGSKYATEAEYTIACGAFKLEEWVHDSHLKLVKNDKYFETDESWLEEINFKIIKDTNSVMAELYSGNIDRSSVSSTEWREKLIATDNFNYGDYVIAGTCTLIQNTAYESNGVPILSNAKIRRAISACIDRTEVGSVLNSGLAVAAEGYVPITLSVDGVNFSTASNQSLVSDMQSEIDPKALFIEGLEELGVDTDPSKYSIHYLVRSTTTTERDKAEYFYEVFKTAIGFNLEIEQVESSAGLDMVKAGEFGLVSVTYYADFNDPYSLLSSYISSVGSNYKTSWVNERYDECCFDAASSRDTDERIALFAEAETILVAEDAVAVPLYHPMSSMMTAKYVKGFQSEASTFCPTLFATVYIDKSDM